MHPPYRKLRNILDTLCSRLYLFTQARKYPAHLASSLFTPTITIPSYTYPKYLVDGYPGSEGAFPWVAIAASPQQSKLCAQRRCKLTRLPIKWRVTNELRINQPFGEGRGLRHRQRDGGEYVLFKLRYRWSRAMTGDQ